MMRKDFKIEEIKEESAKFRVRVFSAGMIVLGAILPTQVLWHFGQVAPHLALAFTAISTAFVLKYILEAREAYIKSRSG